VRTNKLDTRAMQRRAFVVVIDACGVGELRDAASYGDAGANTLLHVAQAVGGLRLPTLGKLGLGNILALPGVAPSPAPVLHGRLAPIGPGKDSSSGHWELMGVVVERAPPAYPNGLAADLRAEVEATLGRGVICNRPENGLAAIDRYGAEHLESGAPILYTSQDSVLQLAAHTSVVDTEALYEMCASLRAALQGPAAVRRVIARPFDGVPGGFVRTAGRRDYTLPTPSPSWIELLSQEGISVHGVGKAPALFDGLGFSAAHDGATNAQAIRSVDRLLGELDRGLVFANLIETDQVYGHRKDATGFHEALQLIDAALARWLMAIGKGDLLIITADHGCDPASSHTDHTREYAPLLAVFDGHHGRRRDGQLADVGASAFDWLTGGGAPLPGHSFIAHA
jgi:phosphopentomutase